MFKSLFAAAALTLAAACLTPAFADDNKMVRSISLSGHGEVRMAPDLAIVTVGVMSPPQRRVKPSTPTPKPWKPSWHR